ncbi:MAG: BAx inhibitor (BI)-1/yccA-like protein family [Satyrvirus sp.]|uniref:BAx inhibitor (BI)-1/yccA-like protein family n=1 Tax=Satyrvirus sp. TaxID=2487771 RepID=A0A3G5AE47_9VIRU|nr:MAG: BAx inhibitor (BI)-1/yccA-like protein family [Satyrvirus sp.]
MDQHKYGVSDISLPNGLPNSVVQTYVLLTCSIIVFFLGTFVPTNMVMSWVSIGLSFIFLFLTIAKEKSIFMLGYSFCIGLMNNLFLENIGQINPYVIQEALAVTIIIFIGLTILSYHVPYGFFLIAGLLYSLVITLLCVIVINIFVQNTFLEIISIYLGIVTFSGFIIIDTRKLIFVTNHTPVQHTLALFLDFINLFIQLTKYMVLFRKKEK